MNTCVQNEKKKKIQSRLIIPRQQAPLANCIKMLEWKTELEIWMSVFILLEWIYYIYLMFYSSKKQIKVSIRLFFNEKYALSVRRMEFYFYENLCRNSFLNVLYLFWQIWQTKSINTVFTFPFENMLHLICTFSMAVYYFLHVQFNRVEVSHLKTSQNHFYMIMANV